MAVSWLKIVGLGLPILSHETATLPINTSINININTQVYHIYRLILNQSIYYLCLALHEYNICDIFFAQLMDCCAVCGSEDCTADDLRDRWIAQIVRVRTRLLLL